MLGDRTDGTSADPTPLFSYRTGILAYMAAAPGSVTDADEDGLQFGLIFVENNQFRVVLLPAA